MRSSSRKGLAVKLPIATLFGLAFFAVCSTAFALYSVDDRGTWPKSWPTELDRLRETSRTLVGPTLPYRHYAIPFSDREVFESAWRHLLTVKHKDAPIFLVRGPNDFLGKQAGVVIHCPPEGPKDGPVTPEAPIEGTTNPRTRWRQTTYIELFVDGKIVDLNRISLSKHALIIDERFLKTDEPSDERKSR
jgi:hypothetical protein